MKKYPIIKLSIIPLFLYCISFAQRPIVKDIELVGQDITKQYILEREIHHNINVPLDSVLAEEDRQRIENLGIFSMVMLQVFNYDQNEVILRYTVIESWRYFPMITPIYDEKWGWSVGGMLMVNNFRGKNESITVQGQYGGQNTFGIEFIDPWITGDHVSFQIGVANDIYRHNFLQYDVNSKNLQLGVGRYFKDNIRAKVGLNIIDRMYSNELDSKRKFQHIIPFVNLVYDTRDLYANPNSGILSLNKLYYRFDINGDRNNQFVWNQSTSIYKELIGGSRKMIAGFNFTNLLSFSNTLDVWYNYLGGANTIRGWEVPNSKLYKSGDQSYRFGMNWITASAEIRQTIIPKFVTKLDNEFGLSIVAFSDIGVINNNISDLFQETPLLGIGIGIRVPWPVVKSLRLDYGWSFYDGKYMEQSFHLSFGEKF